MESEAGLWKSVKGYDAWDPHQVSQELSDVLTHTGETSVATLSHTLGESRGFELYRQIMRRIRGQGPEHAQRVLRDVQNPKRATNAVELRDSLLDLHLDYLHLGHYRLLHNLLPLRSLPDHLKLHLLPQPQDCGEVLSEGMLLEVLWERSYWN